MTGHETGRGTKWTRQKFLLNSTTYENRTLNVRGRPAECADVQELGVPWNLLDQTAPCFARMVTLRAMDRMVDTEEDWDTLLTNARRLDLLVIDATDDTETTNPILRDYSVATLKAYATRLDNADVNCTIMT